MRGTPYEIDIPIEVEAGLEDDDTTRVAPTIRPTAAHQLGRYELRYTIANGGMATVHIAVSRGAGGFGKIFALKQIHPHLATERSFVEMFLDEARIASLIHHPNVCSVLDFGEADGTYYLTMEYLVGIPLARLCWALRRLRHRRHQSRVPLIAARLIADACEGLHAAHELCDSSGHPLHVVHRDVSPTNLFVTRDGTLKVVDFGVASAANRIHHTATGMVKGRFAYMAPEHLHGTPIDRRADIWSLGVVLWEMVTGRSLFRGKNDSETIMRVVRGQVPPAEALCEGVPSGLDAIIRKAIAVDRAARFPNARAMGHALRKWIVAQGDPIDTIEISEWMQSLFGEELREQQRLANRALSESTGAQILPRLPMDDLGATPSLPPMSGVVPRSRKRRFGRSLTLLVCAATAAIAAYTVTTEVVQAPPSSPRPTVFVTARAPRPARPTPARVSQTLSPQTPVEATKQIPIAAPPRPVRVWLPRPRPMGPTPVSPTTSPIGPQGNGLTEPEVEPTSAIADESAARVESESAPAAPHAGEPVPDISVAEPTSPTEDTIAENPY